MFGVRARVGTAITLVVAVAAAALTATGAGARTPAPAHPTAIAHADSGAIAFSHGVVVDEQRPGAEPDVKVDGHGLVYTSEPFGFSTTQSFVWSSRDHGGTYQLTPGNLGPGKPSTCAGGGDTDLFLDAKDALYFSDLQGLTNISNSMSTDGGANWSTNCVGAPNTPDDRMWFAGTGSSAGGNLVLYQDYDATNTSVSTANPGNSGNNQLVETVSTDGTHFLPVLNADPSALAGDCAGAAVQDCVTDNEGISGNQIVDPKTGNVYIAHTTTEGTAAEPGVRIAEGKITLGSPSRATWSESPNLDAALCPGSTKSADGSGTCVDANGNPMEIAGENFASIARDAAGYLYVTFTAGPLDHGSNKDDSFGALTAPEQIYVVHSLEPAPADPSKVTWSAPQAITGSGTTAGTNTFPWIDAGSDGRVAVAFYHSSETTEKGTCPNNSNATCSLYGAGSFQKAEWTVDMAQSLDAHATSPHYGATQVSEAPIKYGQICTNGLGCTTGGDRSLGDFLQVTHDAQGAALISYVNDTSGDTSGGENTGPEQISRQIAGPGLIAGERVTRDGGPGVPMGSVSDPAGDADYSANGSRTTSGVDNLDLTGASLASGPGSTLTATIRVKSLASTTVSPSLGGPDGSWILRWTQVTPGTTGNGRIYYAGMDNAGGGTPTFFAGSTAGIPPPNQGEHTKYMTFPQTDTLSPSQGAYDAKTGVITMHIPLADVGNPPPGSVLYSATAFSATSLTPQSATTLFNLIDATAPFDAVVGTPRTSSTVAPGTLPHTTCQAATGALTGQTVGPLQLGMTRATARHRVIHYTTRGRRYMDFFCLAPIGIRAGYGSARLVRPLPRAARRRLQGRVVLLLTSDQRYSIKGIFPAEPVTAARALHLSRPIRIGRNTWYVFADGAARGVFKTAHGMIEEIGLANRSLTMTIRAARRFLGALQ